MLTAFTQFISAQKLVKPGEKVLLAVSGGIDSVVMCELFSQSGFSFAIAHCNFKLRGKESDGDEKFVKQLAKKYRAPFYTKSFNTEKYAAGHQLSIQMAARELRYQWFQELIRKEKHKKVAVAHHQNDEIETFLINLVRGTGIAGLHGIPVLRDRVIRPLLFSTREQLEKFARQNQLKYREDSSNQSLKYSRNKIRKKVIPVLKEINPDLESTMLSNMERMRDVEKIYREAIEKKKQEIFEYKNGDVLIPFSKLQKLNPPKAYLYEFLSDFNFKGKLLEQVIASLDGISGKHFFSTTHQLLRDRKHFIISPLKANDRSNVAVDDNTKSMVEPVKMKFSTIKKDQKFSLPVSTSMACFDKALLQFPLQIRKWETGDFFYPLGMKGKKKLSDFFIDHKFPTIAKERTWLLTSGDDIIWVVGHRIDERYKITDKTKQVYFCELLK